MSGLEYFAQIVMGLGFLFVCSLSLWHGGLLVRDWLTTRKSEREGRAARKALRQVRSGRAGL